MLVHEGEERTLDTEWVELLNEAHTLGLSIEEIRNFLKQSTSE